MHWRRLVAIIGSLVFIAAQASAAPKLEDSSFVYGIFAGAPTCADVQKRLTETPLRKTVLLSVESKGFVLDQPEGPDLMTCALRFLHKSGHPVKALMLQDVSFLDRQDESARRAKVLADYVSATRNRFDAIVIDVEPYVDERWSCASAAERRQIGSSYLGLLTRLKASAGRIPVEPVIPWWFVVNDDIPELLPDTILRIADGVYLMAYGDEGGPVVAGRAEQIFRRLPHKSLPIGHGHVYVALATYESYSPADLNTEIGQIRDFYRPLRVFSGTAVFHASSDYNAPLVRVLSGVVTDDKGRGVPAADIDCSGVKAQTNACGKFTVRGMPQDQATIEVTKPGYAPTSVPVDLAPPGRERDLPPIQLSPQH